MTLASTSGVQANAVLVVDSNHGGFGTLAEVLTRSGYTVHAVANPLAALGSIRDFPPSTILLELRSYALSDRHMFSAHGGPPKLPLIVVGPKIDGREKACMLDAGAADYVEFPFDPDELLIRIRSLIRTSRPARLECTLKFGDSRVNLGEVMEGWPEHSLLAQIFVADSDAVFAQAVEAGAEVLSPITDMVFGSREGRVLDPFGSTWTISTHTEDVSVEEMQQRLNALAA